MGHDRVELRGLELAARQLSLGGIECAKDGNESHAKLTWRAGLNGSRRGHRLQVGKDDDARAGLELALDLHFDLLAHRAMGVVDHHHRAIGQIANALAFVLAFADDAQGDRFARQEDDPERFGQVVQVDVIDLLQLGDIAPVVVVGIELGTQVTRQAHQLRINFRFFREVAIVDLDFIARVALDAIEHLQTAAAPGALNGVVGIGDLLELLQHKAWHDDQPLDKIRLDQVGNAAIHDDAGIEQQEIVRFVLGREADIGDDEGEVLFVAAHGEDDADVAEAEEEAEANQPAGRLFLDVFEEAGAVDEESDDRAQEQAEGSRRKGPQRKALEHLVEGDHQPAEAETDDHANKSAIVEADVLRAHLANGEAPHGAQGQE